MNCNCNRHNVVDLPLFPTGRESPGRLLRAYLKESEDIDDIVLIGHHTSGGVFLNHSSEYKYEVLGLIEFGKHKFLEMES